MSGQLKFETKELEDFLILNFNENISNVTQIRGGERSKAYSFISNGIKYIFRINTHDDGFKKDKFAFEHFSKSVPIPKIFKIGSFKDVFYCVSEFCLGTPLTDDNKALSVAEIESIMTVADQIHSIQIPKNTKYGIAGINGIAKYESWREWMLKKNTVVTKDDGSYYSWDEVKQISFVDKEIINRLFSQIRELAHFIPQENYLIHSDFGFGNIMLSNNIVTGVIDWNEFGYGDFLFDIAWLDFWKNKTNFKKAYEINFHKNKLEIPFYEERMMCHKLFIGLNTLGIYSAIGWKDRYDSALKRIGNLKNFSIKL